MLKINNTVSETLLIPLYMKYLAAQQPDPILYDETAMRLVPQLDYDFTKFDQAKGSIIGTAIRARYFDQCTADFICRHPNGVVVILGCGLDGRCQRIGDVAQHSPFYQLDLPEVIALREHLLPPRSNETLLAASAFDTAWMDELRCQYPQSPFLFVIEGVLMYFPEATVRQLMVDLAQRFPKAKSCLMFAVTGQHVIPTATIPSNTPAPVFCSVATMIAKWKLGHRICIWFLPNICLPIFPNGNGSAA